MDKAAHLATAEELSGKKGMTDAMTMKPADAGYRNPGPTANLRGVEANTAPSKGTPMTAPQGVTEITYAKGEMTVVDHFRTWGN